ncbi:hypothetical protein CR513_48039, partial [Mucuna pruriens]
MYQELLSNFLTLSLGYKELKSKFSKLSKDFESLEKENSILKKENEKKRPKGPWVPKSIIILVVDVFNSMKETHVMVLGQWVLTSNDGGRVYVTRPQAKERRMGYLQSIPNILYVKGLKHNLLSISQLCDSGYDVSFNKGECIVRGCNDSIMFSTKR